MTAVTIPELTDDAMCVINYSGKVTKNCISRDSFGAYS